MGYLLGCGLCQYELLLVKLICHNVFYRNSELPAEQEDNSQVDRGQDRDISLWVTGQRAVDKSKKRPNRLLNEVPDGERSFAGIVFSGNEGSASPHFLKCIISLLHKPSKGCVSRPLQQHCPS